MPDFNVVAQTYLTIGAGGVSFITLIVLLFTFIKERSKSNDALKEVAHSNVQVAESNAQVSKALEIFSTKMDAVVDKLAEHDYRAQRAHEAVVRIDERTQRCLSEK